MKTDDARLEGFAREQLARGRGERTIAHELVRMGHLDPGTALDIVRKAESRVGPARGNRSLLLFGVLLIVFPLSLAFHAARGASFHGISEFFMALILPPISFPMIVGIALIAHARRRSRSPGRPVRTGLWWRADPFEGP